MTNHERMTTEQKFNLACELAQMGFCPFFGLERQKCKDQNGCAFCVDGWLSMQEVTEDCDNCKIEV